MNVKSICLFMRIQQLAHKLKHEVPFQFADKEN